jgi:hypothetical protein
MAGFTSFDLSGTFLSGKQEDYRTTLAALILSLRGSKTPIDACVVIFCNWLLGIRDWALRALTLLLVIC